MSLGVAPELLEQASNGEVDEAAFVAAGRQPLPYAAFRPDADSAVYAAFTSTRSQVLNQWPELRNC